MMLSSKQMQLIRDAEQGLVNAGIDAFVDLR